MATALAAQLAQLAAGQPAQERYVRGRPSLLFDYQKAADVSAEQVLSIARAGIEALVKADKRFAPFTESLFSRSGVNTTREQLTAAETDALNANLAAFLRVLTNHFLSAAAFQVLEYCIRRYKVHVYNVNELLLCALPYHATPEFARLLVLLQLKGSTWEWLTPGQQSGAPPPREVIVRRCVNDHAVLRVVCEGAKSVGVPGFVSKTYLSFYAVLLCEVMAAVPRVTEDMLSLLLPYLVAGLKGDASKEYTSATLMVLTQLLARAQLANAFLQGIIVDIVRSWSDLGGPTVLMMLAHLATSQTHCGSIPLKALQVLSQEHTNVAQELSALQARQADLAPLMRLLLPSLTQALPLNPGLEPLATALLKKVTVGPELVQAAAEELLKAGAAAHAAAAAAAPAAAGKQQQHLQQVLRVFDLHYPEQLDAAINAALQESAAAAPAPAAPDTPAKKHKASKKQQLAPASPADALFEFVQTCFAGSRHEVLAADSSEAQQQQARTLSLAVHAPASQMRIMALQKLDTICSAADSAAVPASTRQLLQSSLVSGLRDDVLAVAAVAAAAEGLSEIPAEQQLPALQYLLQRAAGAITAGHVAAAAAADAADSAANGGKEALRAAKAALAAVAAVGQRSESAAVQQQAAAVLLEYCLGDKRCKKLAKAAVKFAVECSWSPLLQTLAAAPAVAAAIDGADAAGAADAGADIAPSQDSKRRKKGKQAEGAAEASDAAGGGKHSGALALNRAVVAALGDAVAADAAAGTEGGLLQQVQALLLSSSPRCQQLLLLVLLHAAAAAAAAAAAGASKASGKGSKQAKGASKAADGAGAAGCAAVAAVLIKALEQHLAVADAAADGSKKSSSRADAALLPATWSEEAHELLDVTHLPTKQHMQQLPTQLQHLNAVLLLSGLHTALSAASAASLSAALGQPVQLFARLASAAATARGAGAQSGLLQHLQFVVDKSGESAEQRLQFLSSIYGLPTGIAGSAVQAVALQLLPEVAAAGTGGGSSSWLVRLLAAANSSKTDVRAAAVTALLALASSKELPGAHLQELLASLQQHEQLLNGSAGALQRLLCSAAAGGAAAMDVDTAAEGGSSRSRRTSKTSGAKSASKAGTGSSGDAAAAAAALQLGSEAAAAFTQLLQEALPSLSSESDLLAAQLAVAVLSAGPDAGASAEAAQQLLQQLLPRLCKPAAAASKGAVWPQLVTVHAGAGAVGAAAAELQQLRTDLAVSLLQVYSPEVLQASTVVADSFVQLLQAPFSSEAAAAVLGHAGSNTSLSAAQLAALAPVRVAALQQFSPEALAALQPQQQQAAFTAALQTLAADGATTCRAAARECLEQLPVSAGMLLVLLQAVGNSAGQPAAAEAPPTQSKPKRARKAGSSSQQQQDASSLQVQSSGVLSADAGASAAQHITPAALDAAVAALEFMQWRDDIPGRQQLLQPLQQVLRLLVPLMGSIAEAHEEGEEADADADASELALSPPAAAVADAEGSAGSSGAVSASAAGYAAQLVLLVLQQLAQEQVAAGAAAAAGGVDVDLVLSCASAAPDGAVRNAALLLMAALAQLAPEDVLEHVLKALAVIQHSAALQADAHSQAVASTTLSALVPAWLAAGRGSEELWGSLLAALPGLPAHRRLGLLESLLTALPEDQGLSVGLLLMMQHLVDLSAARRAAAAAAAAATAASPGSSSKGKKGKKQAAAVHDKAPPASVDAAGDDDQESWLPELMASLCEKVDVQARLDAFAAVLSGSLSNSTGPLPAHETLPRMAVSFVAVNLKAKSVSSTIATARSTAAANTPEVQASLQEACQSIMTQALQHLLHLNPAAADAGAAGSGKQARRLQKAINAAADGVFSLLAALEAVQDGPSYMLALVQMSKQQSDSVQRRALKLLADRLSKAQIDLADVEASTTQLSASAQQDARRELAEAGLAVCVELPRLMSPSTPALTQQLALIAADAGIRQFGGLLHPVVLACMLQVLQVVDSLSAPVRTSALTCLAAGVGALGMQLVPLLPKTAAAVLAAAEAAAQGLATQQQKQDGDSSSSDGEGDSDVADATQQGSGEGVAAAALELAAALTVLEALVSNLGAFMSPYLPRLLQLLLHLQVLSCTVADANAVAGRLRGALPVKVPARLLLQPLLQQWDSAVAACAGGSGQAATAAAAGDVVAAPAVALLDLVAAFCSSLQPSEAVAHHEQLSGLLLQALSTRSKWLASSAGQQLPSAAAAVDADTAAAAAAAVAGFSAQHVWQIEGAGVRALAALTMKLSESRFKPMFLRMLDWTNASAAGEAQQQLQGVGRIAALFAAVCTFSERLRNVFAPYYKYFFPLLMQQLAGEALSGGKRSKKKRKLSAAAAGATGADSSSAALLSTWLARLRAVRAVHLLALHEGSQDSPAAQQEQHERFDKLMPLLVEVLQEGPPAAVAGQLAVQGADSALDLPNLPVAALGDIGAAIVEAGGSKVMQESCDIVGTAAVGALVQMAIAGGSDVVWKPLHHALLLATRGGSTRAKLLALGAVSRLADLLREDYLNLLPEALGFIAELVEDGELAVEAAAQGLLAQLEVLSGEKLEQYLKAG